MDAGGTLGYNGNFVIMMAPGVHTGLSGTGGTGTSDAAMKEDPIIWYVRLEDLGSVGSGMVAWRTSCREVCWLYSFLTSGREHLEIVVRENAWRVALHERAEMWLVVLRRRVERNEREV